MGISKGKRALSPNDYNPIGPNPKTVGPAKGQKRENDGVLTRGEWAVGEVKKKVVVDDGQREREREEG